MDQCRLVPAHKDAPEEQMAGFPALAQLSPEELADLRDKLKPTDRPSFVQVKRARVAIIGSLTADRPSQYYRSLFK